MLSNILIFIIVICIVAIKEIKKRKKKFYSNKLKTEDKIEFTGKFK